MATKKKTAGDKVDQQLARYREMRDFSITAEPSGKSKTAARKTGLPFVIQKHAASHLHYDFRLGWAGVLKSWAVAKGPSYNPKDRRLAVQVEDHPIEYGGFEGIIPQGQYGGGTVMVWDQGTWSPQPGYENVDAGLHDGTLKFELHGTKLQGKWTLVRMSGARWGSSSKPNWLLIKEHDDYERGPGDPTITDEAPDSAITGRTMEQIAAQEDHIWNSKDAASNKATQRKRAPRKTSASHNAATRPSAKDVRHSRQPKATLFDISELPDEPQPRFIEPQLALETDTPPEGDNWIHEMKFDGYRIQARKSGDKVQLLTRKGLDWTDRMRPVAEAVARIPTDRVTLDGEVCVLADDGTTSFADLQAWFQGNTPKPLLYYVFDLLHLDGHNTRELPLLERKTLLKKLLTRATSESLQFSDHLQGSGLKTFHEACALHAEGIVSKRIDQPYASTRSAAWLKTKCRREQEFVIGGFTDSSEGADRIGALLLGIYDDHGKLIYCGRTGTGFTQQLKRQLRTQLNKLETKSTPFDQKPSDARSDIHWVRPKLVAEVRFATWTADNLVRQAAFLGLREDKPANEVRREGPTVTTKPKAARTRKTSASHTATNAHLATFTTSAKTGPSLTHPDKILDPTSHLTKRDLADYYSAIAQRMLPHIADRPLSLVRCPDGTEGSCFYQKHATNTLPPEIGSIMITDKTSSKPEPYITLDTTEALTSLAQLGVLEIHPWGSRNDDLEHPDRIIFDLDPDPALPWPTLAAAADDVRKRLKQAGLTSFLKTTGGKGLHVVAPLEPTLTWAELKNAAHRLVLAMERDNPDLYLTKMTKSARTGKIFLDYLRNERGSTAVAPFSPRARKGAPVSLPLPWSALKLSEHPHYAAKDFRTWFPGLRSDPWRSFFTLRQTLDPAKL